MGEGSLAVAETGTQSLSKAEQRKLDSDHLRDPLLSELSNDDVRFTEDAVQLLKFHGSYQQHHRELRKTDKVRSWQMMLRLRSPGGRIPARLFLALDDLSNRLGDGTLRATTRQAFQMHGIAKADLKEVIGTIVRNMGSTLAACGDINRNVMAPPAPFEKGGYPVARRLADEIADLLSPEAAEGAYLDLWVDGDLSYRFKPSRAVQKARKRQSESGVFSGSTEEPLYGDTYLPRKFRWPSPCRGTTLLTCSPRTSAWWPSPTPPAICGAATSTWAVAWDEPTTRRRPSPAPLIPSDM